MKFSSTLIAILSLVYNAQSAVVYDSSKFKGSSLKKFGFKGRKIFPAGPDLTGYGLGALEQIAYDHESQIIYGMSEQGFVNIFKFSKDGFEDLELSIDFDGAKLTDVEVCGGLLFVSLLKGVEPGEVQIFEALKLNEKKVPSKMTSVTVGVGPDMIKPNSDCSMLAVANEGEGKYDGKLIDPVGSVSLVTALKSDSPVVQNIALDKYSDAELLEKDVHMPLTKNALEYWDDHSDIADDLDFSEVRSNYSSDMNLEPEYVAWSADDSKLIVNMQENSAAVIIDVESSTGVVNDIFSYGLKDWSQTTIDVIKDDGCENMQKIEGLYSIRTPDSIAYVSVDGKDYILTANEGDDKEYGDFEEKQKSGDIFDGDTIALKDMTANPSVFDEGEGTSAMFNSECEGDNCSKKMRMSVGSSMIDYSDPTKPNIERMVIFGGRGISIYEVSDSLKLIWDSGDEFEKEGCKAYPWAHGGIQDEEFAPVGGTLYNMADDDLKETIEEVNDPEEDGCDDGGDGKPGACPLGKTVDERSPKDGYAPESIVVGKACGRLYAATVSEKNSVGFLYDITLITSPKLEEVFHLSPISETLNPGLAYDGGEIGEIDAESIIFLDEDESPTGKAGILFAGAFSGTISWWDFECEEGKDDKSSATTGFLPHYMTQLPVLVLFAFAHQFVF